MNTAAEAHIEAQVAKLAARGVNPAVARNMLQLVYAGAGALMAACMTEEEVVEQLPALAGHAVEFLRDKAANVTKH